MAKVIVTKVAAEGLELCRRFLAERNPRASLRAGQVIDLHFAMLESDAMMGRLVDDSFDLRELIIPFGNSGYVALYRYESPADTIYILAFRHQKESGY